ncbi:hypothetical protein EVAR_19256_1 [Eumeta japonica]|uniref:Uncharacterized protein n=1 Tax=Eumeta variegata TaxID=151549 RepID=A0A4C1UEI3_EUMVA|nr:hypothetical protein EVAR_19256_1 [Eumeta japonica]
MANNASITIKFIRSNERDPLVSFYGIFADDSSLGGRDNGFCEGAEQGGGRAGGALWKCAVLFITNFLISTRIIHFIYYLQPARQRRKDYLISSVQEAFDRHFKIIADKAKISSSPYRPRVTGGCLDELKTHWAIRVLYLSGQDRIGTFRFEGNAVNR